VGLCHADGKENKEQIIQETAAGRRKERGFSHTPWELVSDGEIPIAEFANSC
jgi:hypothetical protein